MSVIIAKQPNGLLCCMSTETDEIIAYNMSEEEYIVNYLERQMKYLIETAKDNLKHIKPFSRILYSLHYEKEEEECVKNMLAKMGYTDELPKVS